MAIQGLRDTSLFVTDQRPKNWREGILLLNPNGTAPLFALTAAMREKPTDDPEFSWWEKEAPDQRLTLTADLPAWDATIGNPERLVVGQTSGVNNGIVKGVKLGDILYVVQTGEYCRVRANPVSGNNYVEVDRNYLGNPATGGTGLPAGQGAVTVATQNPDVIVIGSAYEEGSSAPVGVNFDPVKRYNYTQIFRDTLEMTRTASRTRLRTGDAIREARREALFIHSAKIEKALFFGRRHEGVVNGRPWRTTGGVIEFIDAGNVYTWQTSDTFDTFEEQMERMFRYGSSEKMGFCGNAVVLKIQKLIRSVSNVQWQFLQGQREFGMNVSRLVSPFGELVLRTHPLFNQMPDPGQGNPSPSTWLVVLDMAELVYRPFVGADTKFQGDIQTPGDDALKAGFLTEAGLEVHHPKAHYLIKGLK